MQNKLLIKEKIIDRVAHGKDWGKAIGWGREKWQVGNDIVHVRYRTRPASGGVYSYNINPNTLKSDYELWICSDENQYYLIPISVIKEIYYHPGAYVDHTHPDMRVADVDLDTHRCRYARSGQTLDFSGYYRAILTE